MASLQYRLLFSCAFNFVCLFGISEQTESKYADKLLLVSMDGFRWDFLYKTYTPNFDKFIKNGIKVEYVNNSFVTKTFPAHYTIVTGVYEETHGIVSNSMYDPVFKETFNMRTKTTKWWNASEPIWCYVKRFNLNSGSYFWPGDDTIINGIRPNKWLKYAQATPFRKRVDDVMDWFTKDNFNFVSLYFHEPDSTGHRHGPESPEVNEKVGEMDELLGYLVTKLEEKKLTDKVNVIITSDHGMYPVDVKNKVVDIYDYVKRSQIQRTPLLGPVAQIQPVDGQTDAVVDQLRNVPHITVYHKRDIPDRLHYKHNRRIMSVLVMADEGWLVTDVSVIFRVKVAFRLVRL
ncbi:ectonucleotide pyrophosphatase/phosphodiesterase family member 5-like isoform X2 [Gigantopelta aegis]|uniref:ectonucleotide pyrophosphatase/phosphodiesterase family member 5-like isoform X2 n=1 Tax=Gigantopelta aegis TaxID=1735272 RepID=UPI001B88D4F9|nr:ectonucleotide pyrophosphatase/phosphodiesterase family member 5-like isoform X2 [Gigantopelta aegis]